MSLTHEPPSNIVALESQKELEILLKRKEGHPCSGKHRQIVVDSKSRTITCEVCGHTVDAFDYIEQWAIDGDRKMTGLKGLEAARRVLTAEIGELWRELESVRGKMKRSGLTPPERWEIKNKVSNAEWKASQGIFETVK